MFPNNNRKFTCIQNDSHQMSLNKAVTLRITTFLPTHGSIALR